MSLRKQAKILGIFPTYLSLLLNGKKPWRVNLKERYQELVNTFVNTPEAITPLPKASKDDFVSGKKDGGAGGTRTLDFLNAIEALDKYLEFLEIKALSDSYILSNRQYLGGFVNTASKITVESAYSYFSRCKHRKVNTRIRYAGYLKGFLQYMGLSFDISINRPKLLPEFVNTEDISKLRDTLRNHKTHKSSVFRDLVLVDTAIKTGLRRSELANLLVCHVDISDSRLIVVAGKGRKDRVIPLCESLRQDLEKLTHDKRPNESVFGLNYRSLGMKIKEW